MGLEIDIIDTINFTNGVYLVCHTVVCACVCVELRTRRGDEPRVKVQYIVRTSSWSIFTHIRGQKNACLLFLCWPSDRHNFLHKARQHSAVVSCAKFRSDHKFMPEYQIGIIDVFRYCEGQCRLWVWFAFSISSNCIFSEIKLGVICTAFCYYSLRHVAKLLSQQTDLDSRQTWNVQADRRSYQPMWPR